MNLINLLSDSSFKSGLIIVLISIIGLYYADFLGGLPIYSAIIITTIIYTVVSQKSAVLKVEEKKKDINENDKQRLIDAHNKFEPYKINYTNPFLTNLDSINFNFRFKYNSGDFKTYIFNKIDELLISKYISFYKVLSFNKFETENIKYNDNITNLFIGLENDDGERIQNPHNFQIYNKTKALVLMRGHMLFIPSLNYKYLQNDNIVLQPTLNNKTKYELYIYIFEKNDLNLYKKEDNLTIINDNNNNKNRGTIIDTNLNSNTQYVAYISFLREDDIKWPSNLTTKVKYKTELNKYRNEEKNSEYKKYIENILRNMSFLHEDNIKDNAMSDYYFPEIKDNTFYLQDHNDYINRTNKVISDKYPYLLVPIILIDKPNININKPLFYKNTDDKQKNIKFRNWLLKEYYNIIEKQFKGQIFNINTFYKQFADEARNLKYNNYDDNIEKKGNSSMTTNEEILIGKNFSKNLPKSIKNFYQKNKHPTIDIQFMSYNNLHQSKTILNTYAFNITIENILNAVDYNNKPLDKDIMPYLKIDIGKIKQNKIPNSQNVKKELEIFSSFIINLSINNENNITYKKYIKYPLLINNINTNTFFNYNDELFLEKNTYINKITKIKEELELLNKPDNNILDDINQKIDQFNSDKVHNKIYISENFINTSFLYDYKIKMNMIISKILFKFFDSNLLSIQNYSFNFDKLNLIKLNKLLRYNNKRLILNNIFINNTNINRYYKDIFKLRSDFKAFLLDKYKELWYLKEYNSINTGISNYFIKIHNNLYYSFDYEKAVKNFNNFHNNFHNNFEYMINRKPYINHIKEEGYIKYIINHIGLRNNLIITKNDPNNNNDAFLDTAKKFDSINFKTTTNNINKIKYIPFNIDNDNFNIQNNDYILFYNKSNLIHNIQYLYNKDNQNKCYETLINNFNLEDNFIQNNDGLVLKINNNIKLQNCSGNQNVVGYQNVVYTPDPIYVQNEFFDRKFIYVSENFFSNQKTTNIYKYPFFIKIGPDINSLNTPYINLNNICSKKNIETNNINNIKNIFPVINAFAYDTNSHTISTSENSQYSSENIILLEIPNSSNINSDYNNLKENIKQENYKIFDYTLNFKKMPLIPNSRVTKIIINKKTPTRFKIQFDISEDIFTKYIDNIKNSNIYEKYITLNRGSIQDNYDEINNSNKKVQLLFDIDKNLLIQQNKLYQLINICPETTYDNYKLNNFSIELETFYPVYNTFEIDNIFSTGDGTKEFILNKIEDNINAVRYINHDKYQNIIEKSSNEYIIKNKIVDTIDNINNIYDTYKLEQIKRSDNINTDIWNYNSFYKDNKIIKFLLNKFNTNSIIELNTIINKLIDNIIFNEVSKIYYNVPKDIGIIKETTNFITQFKYDNKDFVPYYKRNKTINKITIYTDSNICLDYGINSDLNEVDYGINSDLNKKELFIDQLSLYALSIATYDQYYYYYKNIFINILGLYDDVHKECNNFIKLGKSVLNKNTNLNQTSKLLSLKKYIKIPFNLNKYLTFSKNFMLFIRNNKKILNDNNSSITSNMLGLPIIINNSYFDSNYLSVFTSNNENTKRTKEFLTSFVKKYNIGISGYTMDIAEEICSRIHTVYNKNCKNTKYKYSKNNKFNIEDYKHNKERDKCFNTVFNDRTDDEQEKLEKEGKWIYPNYKYVENSSEAQKNINPLIKKDLTLIPHRISNIYDIEKFLFKGMSLEGYGLIQDDDKIMQYSPLIEPKNIQTKSITNKIKNNPEIKFINRTDIDNYANKALFCYGRKPDNTKLSKEQDAAIYYFNQQKVKQNIKDIKEYENIEYYNIPKQNYSAWN